MLSKYVWDNITQENYFHNVGLEHTDLLSLENRLSETCPVACFLTGYNITEQFWLFLFNVSSGVHLRLSGQQWTGANIDWTMYINIIKKQCVLPVITTVALQYSSCTWVRCTVKEKAWVTKKSHCGENWEWTLFLRLHICIMSILLLQDLSMLSVVDHLWPVIYKYRCLTHL